MGDKSAQSLTLPAIDGNLDGKIELFNKAGLKEVRRERFKYILSDGRVKDIFGSAFAAVYRDGVVDEEALERIVEEQSGVYGDLLNLELMLKELTRKKVEGRG